MSDRSVEIERIAQEEIYPERHNRKFVRWPSERTKEVHMLFAEARYKEREVEQERIAKEAEKSSRAKKSRTQQTDTSDEPEPGDVSEDE